MRILCLLINILFFAAMLHAQEVYNTKNGLWSDPTNWSNGIIPSATTPIILNYGLTVDINASCKSFNTNGHNVTINSGYKLNVISHVITTSPAIGTYGKCDSSTVVGGGWGGCGFPGFINAEITNIDTTNKFITFELKRCDDSLFTGDFSVTIFSDNACYGINYGTVSFYSINSPAITVTVNDKSMTGSKSYEPVLYFNASSLSYPSPVLGVSY